MKILIPAAGEGRRFKQAGYTFPKPLIDVDGKPMIQRVIENLDFDADYIFVVQESWTRQYNIDAMLRQLRPGCHIVTVDGVTEGAACTAMLASDFIDGADELLIANSDQVIQYSSDNFNTLCKHSEADAVIYTFRSTHPKWSFARLDSEGYVFEVVEKKPISDIATCGVYWFRHGHEFIFAANRMMAANRRTNGEFYIAPTLSQENFKLGGKILPFFVEHMHGLGTPEDLQAYLSR